MYDAGSNVLIIGGDGNDTIQNRGDTVTIEGNAGDDYISSSYGSNVSISGGKGNDDINVIRSEKVTISGGDGNDDIYNAWEHFVTIAGGKGADTINNTTPLYLVGDINGVDISINCGSGNDCICSDSWNTTITGGTGNDLVSLISTGNLIQYKSGDGKDTIYAELERLDVMRWKIDSWDAGWYQIRMALNAANNCGNHDVERDNCSAAFKAVATLSFGGTFC